PEKRQAGILFQGIGNPANHAGQFHARLHPLSGLQYTDRIGNRQTSTQNAGNLPPEPAATSFCTRDCRKTWPFRSNCEEPAQRCPQKTSAGNTPAGKKFYFSIVPPRWHVRHP